MYTHDEIRRQLHIAVNGTPEDQANNDVNRALARAFIEGHAVEIVQQLLDEAECAALEAAPVVSFVTDKGGPTPRITVARPPEGCGYIGLTFGRVE